jgi:hypothetical protein
MLHLEDVRVTRGGHKGIRSMIPCDVGERGAGLRHYGVDGLGNILGVTGQVGGQDRGGAVECNLLRI